MTEPMLRRAPGASLILFVLGLGALPAMAAPADDVKALFERGNAREAYELGAKNPEQLGNPAFDYYYGLAAIDSGHAAHGVLALERYLLNNPGSVSARLELGRGYYLMGDNVRARQVFEEAKSLSPPPDVDARINGYLAAIRDRESAYRTAVTGFAEVGGGHDSNVNGGVANSSIVVPVLGPVEIDPLGRETAARFWSLAAGLNVSAPVSARSNIFFGIGAENREYRDADNFDQLGLGGAFGMAWRESANQYRLSLSGGRLDVGGERYRKVGAVTFEWNRSLGSSRGFGLFGQAAQVGYEGDNSLRDSRLYTIGASWQQSFEGPWKPHFTASAIGATEENRRGRDDLARDLVGLRASLGLAPAHRVNVALSAGWQQSRYQESDPFFETRRKDDYLSAEAAAGYLFTPNFGVRIELGYFDNRSNIELYEYDRFVAALKLRYDFK